jgi:hypothetical protein
MNPEIVVTISPKGEVSLEVQNAKGTSCTSLTAAFEAALGMAGHKQLKPEFYEQDQRIRAQN